MKIERITATIKYSQDTGRGAWKSLEIGAEGTVDAKDNWQQAQHQLYGELSQQLKDIWCGKVSESAVQPVTVEEPLEHYCQAHSVPFKQYNKGDSSWYAHKAGDFWCNEGK